MHRQLSSGCSTCHMVRTLYFHCFGWRTQNLDRFGQKLFPGVTRHILNIKITSYWTVILGSAASFEEKNFREKTSSILHLPHIRRGPSCHHRGSKAVVSEGHRWSPNQAYKVDLCLRSPSLFLMHTCKYTHTRVCTLDKNTFEQQLNTPEVENCRWSLKMFTRKKIITDYTKY